MRPSPLSARLRAHGALAGFFVLTWLLGGLWALATPPMGVPDEPAHVIRAAALVRGQVLPERNEVPGAKYDSARVPGTLAYPSVPCFAQAGSPRCARPPGGSGDVLVAVESRAGRDLPAYYALVGLPTLVRPGASTVYVMRFVTAALVAAFVALAVVALRELDAPRWGVAGLAVAVTPMTLFLAGSVNPSAVEISSALALWATLLVWTTHPDATLDRSRALRAGVAGVALVGTRALGPLVLAIIVGAAALSAPSFRSLPRSRPVWWLATVIGAATVAALGWTVGSRRLATGDVVVYPEYENLRRYLFDVVVSLDYYERQMVGVFGWLDTPAPAHLYRAWFAVLGFLVLGSLAIGRRRTRMVVLALIALSALLPVVLQWPAAPELGIIWQGRYELPVMVGLPLVAAITLASDRTWNDLTGTRAWGFWSVVGTLAVAHVVAFWWALHRNVIGLTKPWISFSPLWQPPLGWVALTVAYALAVAAWAALLGSLARPRRESVSPPGSGRASGAREGRRAR